MSLVSIALVVILVVLILMVIGSFTGNAAIAPFVSTQALTIIVLVIVIILLLGDRGAL